MIAVWGTWRSALSCNACLACCAFHPAPSTVFGVCVRQDTDAAASLGGRVAARQSYTDAEDAGLTGWALEADVTVCQLLLGCWEAPKEIGGIGERYWPYGSKSRSCCCQSAGWRKRYRTSLDPDGMGLCICPTHSCDQTDTGSVYKVSTLETDVLGGRREGLMMTSKSWSFGCWTSPGKLTLLVQEPQWFGSDAQLTHAPEHNVKPDEHVFTTFPKAFPAKVTVKSRNIDRMVRKLWRRGVDNQ